MPAARCTGPDRDAGAIGMSRASGCRRHHRVPAGHDHEIELPAGSPGLVIVNPPYGTRLGESKDLSPLYPALGQVLMSRFTGWRVGIISSEPGRAHATGLPFLPTGAPVPHGGLRVSLFRTGPMA